jgi:hypothetical protein
MFSGTKRSGREVGAEVKNWLSSKKCTKMQKRAMINTLDQCGFTLHSNKQKYYPFAHLQINTKAADSVDPFGRICLSRWMSAAPV